MPDLRRATTVSSTSSRAVGGRFDGRDAPDGRQLAEVQDGHLGVRLGGIAHGEVDGCLARLGVVDGE